jgi:hypothetical protein
VLLFHTAADRLLQQPIKSQVNNISNNDNNNTQLSRIIFKSVTASKFVFVISTLLYN